MIKKIGFHHRPALHAAIFTLLFSLPLMSGAKSKTPEIDADVGYVSISSLPGSNAGISPIRLQALRETAIQLGATGALAWRSLHINAQLKTQANYLDTVFNFNRLLLRHNVLPPVISEADENFALANNETIRLADKTYRLISPARFVTTAPNWREYLFMNYAKPTMPDHTLLPQSKAEAEAWNEYLRQGWKQGLEQANAIFDANLSRLKRDYMGMLLYRKLLAQRIVSAPFVAASDLGVTGNSKEIHIGDRVMRITQNSQLQPDSSQWQPILTK